MKLTINLSGKDTVYIKSEKSSEEGGFSLVLFRAEGRQDHIGFSGDSKYQAMCLKIADAILEVENG